MLICQAGVKVPNNKLRYYKYNFLCCTFLPFGIEILFYNPLKQKLVCLSIVINLFLDNYKSDISWPKEVFKDNS